MAKRTLTDRTIRALKPAAPGKRIEVSDGLVPGLWIRITDKGTKSFVLVARYAGSKNPTRRTLGTYGELTLEQARDKARGWLALVARGIDPAEQEERERLAEQRKRANSFAAVAEDFIIDKVRSERQGFEVERVIRNTFIPAWEDAPLPTSSRSTCWPSSNQSRRARHTTLTTFSGMRDACFPGRSSSTPTA
jgi:hypothetical protein